MPTSTVARAVPTTPQAILIEHAQTISGEDSPLVNLLTEKPLQFWTMLKMMRMGIPPHMASAKVLRTPPTIATDTLVGQLVDLAVHSASMTVFGNPPTLDIAAIMAAAGIDTVSNRVADSMRRILRGNQFALNTIRTGMELAIEKNQTLGVEIEVTPKGKTSDDIYEAMKAKLEANNYKIALHPAKANFIYGPQPGIFPTTFGHFSWEGTTIETGLLQGTSSIMHTVTWDDDNSIRLPALARTLVAAAEELYARVAQALSLPSVEDVKNIMAQGNPYYTETRLSMFKDNDGDIANIIAELLPNGRAKLTADNCFIYDDQGKAVKSFEIDAPGATTDARFAIVAKYLKARVTNAGEGFTQKIAKYGGMTVDGIKDEFKVVMEANFDREIITPVLTLENQDVVGLIIEGLHEAGFEGTRPKNVVGIHVHAGLPLTRRADDGKIKHTIAPVVNLMRAYTEDATEVNSGIPTDENRRGFIHRVRPELRAIFEDPNYIADPTNTKEILRICADIVRLSSNKYTEFNLDNHISKLLGIMVKGGDVDIDGAKVYMPPILIPGEDYNSTHNGQDYIFDIITEDGEANVRLRSTSLLPDDRPLDDNGKPKQYLDLIRIKETAWKNTVEFRHFDTILQDPRIAKLYMQFVGSYVRTLGRRHLLSMNEVHNIRSARTNTAYHYDIVQAGLAAVGQLFAAAPVSTHEAAAASAETASATLLRGALQGYGLPDAAIHAYLKGDGDPETRQLMTELLLINSRTDVLEELRTRGTLPTTAETHIQDWMFGHRAGPRALELLRKMHVR